MGGRHPRISTWRADSEGERGRGRSPWLLVTMLLPVLLLLLRPFPDLPSVAGHPLYMRLPPSTLQGEPGLL